MESEHPIAPDYFACFILFPVPLAPEGSWGYCRYAMFSDVFFLYHVFLSVKHYDENVLT